MKRNKLFLLLVASPMLFACNHSSNQSTSSPQLTIEVKDLTPPVIKLKQKTVTLKVGSAFKVADYVKVNDNMDKQVSYDVSGKIDTKKVGTYTLEIKSVDKTGNASHATLKITVKEKPLDSNKKGSSETKDTNVPVTGTDKNEPSTGDTKKTTPSSPTPPSKNVLSGKKYLYKDGYNQITASAACNQDLVNSPDAGACIILFDDTGMDIGMMLQ